MKKSLILFVLFVLVFILPITGVTPAGPGMVVINEISSTGKYDFIELYNTTRNDLTIGISWKLTDRKESRLDNDPLIEIPDGTIIPANGYLLIAPYKTSSLSFAVPEGIPEDAVAIRSFAIGSKDEITLFYDGSQVDFFTWDSDVNSIGRVHDGGNEISLMLIPTPGKKNEPELYYPGSTPLLINEVCSRGLDYIELINISSKDVIIGKNEWIVEDSMKNDYVVIPENTVIPAGGLLVIYPDVIRLPFSAPKNSITSVEGLRFGLGNSDSVILKYHGMITDVFTWANDVTSAGRLPDGGKTWDMDLFLTPGKPNRD